MEEQVSVKTKADVSEKVWKKVKGILEVRQISQVALQRACQERGYRVSQPEISKLYSGKTQLTLYQLTAFSEVLDIPFSYLINAEAEFRRVNVEGNAFLTDPEDAMFQGYLGKFYTIFHATAPDENDKILSGVLTFEPSIKGKVCEARFVLNTGQFSTRGKEISKYYKGQLIISTLGVAYCILVNEKMGEFNVISFRHRSFWVRQIACRMGIALTATAGEEKCPVAHKVFLSRCPLSKELADRILPFLKMESGGVYVRKEELEGLLEREDLDYDFSKLLEEEMEECLLVDNALLRKGKKRMNRVEFARILGTLKGSSIGSYAEFLSTEEDIALYELIQKEENRSDSG